MAPRPMQVAIIGAGPAGFFASAALAGAGTDIQVDLIDRLPTPFGLIRSGVAPDHQETKSIQEVFSRTAQMPGVRFIGNLQIGRDVSLATVRACYDAVILASGVQTDARLGIPGEELSGVHGAAEFVGWYNGHPDQRDLEPRLDGPVVVLGNGNVALDVARILSRERSELEASDIASHAAEAIARARLQEITIAGRRGPVEASFTNVELTEIGALSGVAAITEAAALPDAVPDDLPAREKRQRARNLECFRAFGARTPAPGERIVRFMFHARPVAFLGEGRLAAVRFESTAGSGETFDVPAGLAITSIGYRADGAHGLPVAQGGRALVNEEGRIDQGLYVAGWLKRGPSGKIGSNRVEAEAVAARLLAECGATGAVGWAGLVQHLPEDARPTTFDDWTRIDTAETGRARPGAPREKFTRIAEMLDVLSG